MSSNFESLERALASVPPNQWRMRKAIILDWHDGPHEGLCELSTPLCCFLFQLFADEAHPDTVGPLFILSEMSLGAVDQLASILTELGEQMDRVWIPIWRFTNQAAQIRAEQDVDRLLATARPTNITICTKNIEQFSGCWQLAR